MPRPRVTNVSMFKFQRSKSFACSEAATAAAAAAAADSPRPRGSESPLSEKLDCTVYRVASANVLICDSF